MVGTVVDDQDEGPDPVGVGGPAEHHQGDRCVVVDEHLPKVLSPHVKKLAETSEEYEFLRVLLIFRNNSSVSH